jgi:hypothetical protein
MRQLEQAMTISGNSPHTLTFPEAAGQTFEMGAPVALDAAGAVIEAATPAASVVGVAAMPANGAGASRYAPPPAGKPVTVWIANDDTLFNVTMVGAVAADRGKLVTIKKTGALWAADRATAGTFLVMEVDVSNPGAVPIARGKFLESATQMAKTA